MRAAIKIPVCAMLLFFALSTAAAQTTEFFTGTVFAEMSDFDRRYYCQYEAILTKDSIFIILRQSGMQVKQYDDTGFESVVWVNEQQGSRLIAERRTRTNIKAYRRGGKLYAVRIKEADRTFHFFAAHEKKLQ